MVALERTKAQAIPLGWSGILQEAAAIAQTYGPLAFGVVILLAVWRFIVSPELAASRATMASVAAATVNQKDAAALALQAAQLSHATAETLKQAVNTLAEARRNAA